ncbi:MAG: hypothetical protein ACK553_03775 [Planctomycetota bacterium]
MRAAIGREIGGGAGFLVGGSTATGDFTSDLPTRLFATSFDSAATVWDLFPPGFDSTLPPLGLVGGAILATECFPVGTLANLGWGLMAAGVFGSGLAGFPDDLPFAAAVRGAPLDVPLAFFGGLDGFLGPRVGVFKAFAVAFFAGAFLAEAPFPPAPADAGRAERLVFFFFEGGTLVSPWPSSGYGLTLQGVVNDFYAQYAYRRRSFPDFPSPSDRMPGALCQKTTIASPQTPPRFAEAAP